MSERRESQHNCDGIALLRLHRTLLAALAALSMKFWQPNPAAMLLNLTHASLNQPVVMPVLLEPLIKHKEDSMP